MLGVKTIGNATLVAFDGGPILATDPWIGDEDPAYFGSWKLSHVIPAAEKQEILDAKHVWFSHGHPDHLNPDSLPRFKDRVVLLPDHVGSRIATNLKADGFEVRLLPDRRWVDLSSHVRVMCIADYIQDAILLVDVNGRLFIDLNDAGVRGCAGFIKSVSQRYEESYLLKLSGYGDADMINLWDEEGRRIEPFTEKPRVGLHLSNAARAFGASAVIPFSSFHTYQRSDSVWANAYTTPVSAYDEGFDHGVSELIAPFVFIDCDRAGERVHLDPALTNAEVKTPEDFGDSWSDELEHDDIARLTAYFQRKEYLHKDLGFLEFTVGGKTHTVALDGPKQKGISFETPRASLMAAIEYEIFDDLLIGNFMKTTLHGISSLYDPNFNFVVTKYADNGRAESMADVKEYIREYRRRAGREWIREVAEQHASQFLRRYVPKEATLYSLVRTAYWKAKSQF